MSLENRSRSSARSMLSGWVPRIGTPAFSTASARLSGVWPPNWTMTPCSVPFGFLALEDLDDVFFGQRLEIEAVGGVVVGRDGLGVAVDHDGLVAGVAQREGGVAAAIVELDALADAVGAAAEDDDLLAVGRARLVGDGAGERHLVGRVHVGGGRGELGGAGVDALVDRMDVERSCAGRARPWAACRRARRGGGRKSPST